MTIIESKLLDCMKTVFPTVSEDQLPDISIENMAQWDSVATVTIAALLEESFEIEIEPDELVKLTSFKSISAFLNKREVQEKTNTN